MTKTARLESKLGELARAVATKHAAHPLRVICIAGPTSSGKTTFSHKLALALRAVGIAATPLTVDHYYLPLDRQPKFQLRKSRADVDYDSIESMDVELVQVQEFCVCVCVCARARVCASVCLCLCLCL